MPQLTPIEKLIVVADKHGLSANDQLWLILGVSDCKDIESFDNLLQAIDSELSSASVPQPVEPPSPAVTAATRVAEMEAAFDRDLAKRSLQRLTQLQHAGSLYSKPGHDAVRLVVEKEEYANYVRYLEGDTADIDCEPGEIIGGWYTTFADGSIAGIAITHANSCDGGPFVDAFLILSKDAPPTLTNTSLPVTRCLHEDFVFPARTEQDTTKVVRIVA